MPLASFHKSCSNSGVVLVVAICVAMASCSFPGPFRKYDLDTVVSMLFELDSSNFSEDDDIDLSDPEATVQHACDEEQRNVRYIVVK